MVEWENYPPSAEDLKEWREEVYQNVLIPAAETMLRRLKGPGPVVQVTAGVWAWKPENADS